MSRPNILVLMADQLNPRHLGAYGNPVAKTPTIDALARNGVVFDAAYCNSPLCAPSRYAWLTGRLGSRIGAYDNASELSTATPTFAHYARNAGYRTIVAGKMHFCGPDQLHGFEERLTTDIYPADLGWVPDWSNPHQRQDWYHNMRSVREAGPCVRTNQLDFDDEVTFAVRQKLFDRVREDDTRPFFLVASLTHPHDPFAISHHYWDRFEGVPIPVPSTTANDVASDPHSSRIRAMCDAGEGVVTAQHMAHARRAYYGAIAYVDDQFAAILEALKATGQDQNTVIIVLSDHGEMLGERGLWYKMHLFEDAIRIPLIVHWPQQFSGHRVATPVSLVDFLPTVADLSGATTSRSAAPLAADLDGQSLLPLLSGASAGLGETARRSVAVEYLAEGALAPIVMRRAGPYKLIHSPADPDLLFKLDDDPQERFNRATSTHPTDTIARATLRAAIAERWDFATLTHEVIRSQNQRRFVHASNRQGKIHSWDYQVPIDAAQRFVRNHLKLDDLEARARFPRP